MTYQMKELADRWILPLRGSRVTGIDWNDNVQILLNPEGKLTVGRGALLTHGPVSAPDANVRTLGQLGQEGTARRCAGSRILSAVGFKNGTLRVVFDSGWHLNVRAAGPLGGTVVTAGDSITWPR